MLASPEPHVTPALSAPQPTPADRAADPTSQRHCAVCRRAEQSLWLAAAVLLVLDVALTAYGLKARLVEANPVASAAMAGLGMLPAMRALKKLALTVAVLGATSLPRNYRLLAPLGLALPYCHAVLVNAQLVAGLV